MRHYKSERLKKLEVELQDLEQWMKLGLVPKKDLEKHKEEIDSVRNKIEEEKERIQFLKESGEGEEYVAPRRTQTKTGYTEMPSLPGVETEPAGVTETFDVEEGQGDDTEFVDDDDKEDATAQEDEVDESYFSDRNRWRRGGILDPDADEW